jgi:type VI secretion system protein ImpD
MSLGSGQRGDGGGGSPADGGAPTERPARLEAPPAKPKREAPWIDSLVEATDVGRPDVSGRSEARVKLAELLQARSAADAFSVWLRWRTSPGARLSTREIAQMLGQDIARLDAMLTEQVNAVLHHPTFQKLEASWRGLRYLVDQAEGTERVQIRVLNVSWKELARDSYRAVEFDQSQLFRKIYSDEFGTPGGQPYSVLLGDYEIWPNPCEQHPYDDLAVLREISHVAAAAFAPFVAGASPAMFGLDDFSALEQPLNLPRSFQQPEYLKWRSFREEEDTRFVALALPRVLTRLPYEDDDSRVDGFRFHEDVTGPDRRKYLWGNATYCFGAVLIRAFGTSGWFANIRGVQRGVDGGGLVTGLPVHSFATDRRGVAPKCSTDVVITEQLEPELSDLGFLPLCHCKETEFSVFYANQSVQKPRKYDDSAATMNARISTMLQYTLCVSRFAHYLKSAARDKLGAFTETEELEDYLHRWLHKYVTADPEASAHVKAEHPLREARVQVREHREKPGCYLCTAHLWPHYELDELTAALKVTTELTPGRTT